MSDPTPFQEVLRVQHARRGQTADRVVKRDSYEVEWEFSLRSPKEPALLTDECADPPRLAATRTHTDPQRSGFCGGCGVKVEVPE